MSSSCINVMALTNCSGDIVKTNLNGGCVRERKVEAVLTLDHEIKLNQSAWS